jgi:type II secretory pathway pseudopilin PulG
MSVVAILIVLAAIILPQQQSDQRLDHAAAE